jgi:hypothetical protein
MHAFLSLRKLTITRSPYTKGTILNIQIHRLETKGLIPQLDGNVHELQARIVDVIEHPMMSIVLKVELERRDLAIPAPSMILKVYDRLYSPRLREFEDPSPATSASEEQFLDFQEVHVPTIFADVRLVPQHATAGRDESLSRYTEIRATLCGIHIWVPLG